VRPKAQRDDCRTEGLDRFEFIRFAQAAKTISAHHRGGAPTFATTFCGHRVLNLVGKGGKPGCSG
jgi:hypothetical protein